MKKQEPGRFWKVLLFMPALFFLNIALFSQSDTNNVMEQAGSFFDQLFDLEFARQTFEVRRISDINGQDPHNKTLHDSINNFYQSTGNEVLMLSLMDTNHLWARVANRKNPQSLKNFAKGKFGELHYSVAVRPEAQNNSNQREYNLAVEIMLDDSLQKIIAAEELKNYVNNELGENKEQNIGDNACQRINNSLIAGMEWVSSR